MKCSDITDEEILAACRAFHEDMAETPDIALADKYPVKVITAKMKKMDRQGKIDYGVSLRTAWPTGWQPKNPKAGLSQLRLLITGGEI